VNKKIVLIMRGLPGSGKSTFIEKNFPRAWICSADDYFNSTGNYIFVKKDLGLAHRRCKNLFQMALENSLHFIVVDNTNTEIWEFETYLQLAKNYSYQAFVVNLEIDLETALQRNIHKVPVDKIFDMAERMEKYPGEILLSNN